VNWTHRWHGRKYLPKRHGQLCRVLVKGKGRAALVEFEPDGYRARTSIACLRRLEKQ